MIYYISLLIVFVPFAIGLVKFKNFNIELKIFFIFVAYGVFNETLSAVLVKVIGVRSNMPQAHFYGVVTFLTVCIFYRFLLNGFIKQKWIDAVIALYTIYYFMNSLFLQSIYVYPGIANAIGSIIILSLVILHFAKVMQEAKIRNLFAEPLIWISAALLIFYSVNLFFLVLFNLLLDFSTEFTTLVVYFRVGFNVLVYTMISIGFLKHKRYSLSKPAGKVNQSPGKTPSNS